MVALRQHSVELVYQVGRQDARAAQARPPGAAHRGKRRGAAALRREADFLDPQRVGAPLGRGRLLLEGGVLGEPGLQLVQINPLCGRLHAKGFLRLQTQETDCKFFFSSPNSHLRVCVVLRRRNGRRTYARSAPAGGFLPCSLRWGHGLGPEFGAKLQTHSGDLPDLNFSCEIFILAGGRLETRRRATRSRLTTVCSLDKLR